MSAHVLVRGSLFKHVMQLPMIPSPHAVDGTQEHNRDIISNSFSQLLSVEIVIYFVIIVQVI